MIKYSIDNINKIIKDTGKQVVLFGAGKIGEMCLYAMQKKKIKVDFFCDSMKRKQGLNFNGNCGGAAGTTHGITPGAPSITNVLFE